MKRCPECRRDYIDETAALLEGPASGREERTAILGAFAVAPSEGDTTLLLKDLQPDSKARNAVQNSIAVLPFVNTSADPDNEYFCDGLAEDLLNALAKIENLKVAVDVWMIL